MISRVKIFSKCAVLEVTRWTVLEQYNKIDWTGLNFNCFLAVASDTSTLTAHSPRHFAAFCCHVFICNDFGLAALWHVPLSSVATSSVTPGCLTVCLSRRAFGVLSCCYEVCSFYFVSYVNASAVS